MEIEKQDNNMEIENIINEINDQLKNILVDWNIRMKALDNFQKILKNENFIKSTIFLTKINIIIPLLCIQVILYIEYIFYYFLVRRQTFYFN